MRLAAAFNGLGLNAKSRYDDEGNLDEGDNDCFSITHYDKENVKDPDVEWPEMKPVAEQKYQVGEKVYTVSSTPDQRPYAVFCIDLDCQESVLINM
jgi:hypothetical protein